MRHSIKTLWVAVIFASAASLPAYAADTNAQPEEDPCPKSAASKTEAKAAAVTETEPVCNQCGTIVRIDSRTKEGEGTGLGAATGAVLGGAAARSVTHGSHRTAAAVVGAVGGGIAGHKIEEHARTENYYLVSVEMDSDSRIEVVRIESIEGWASGDKVRIVGGELLRR